MEIKHQYKCKICKKEFKTDRKRTYCSRDCWKNDEEKHYEPKGLQKGRLGLYGFKKGHIPENKGKGYIHKYHGHKIICINGKEKQEHRHIWEMHNGPIPKGMIIHHKNHIKTDNRIENLEMMTISEHIKIHFPNGQKRGEEV